MKSKWPKELTYCWAIFAPSCVNESFIVAFFCDRPTQHNTHTGLTAFPKNVFFFSSYSFPIDFDWNEQNHPVCSYEPCNLYHSPWPSAYMYMCVCVAVTYPFIVTMMSWFNCWTSQKNKPLSQFSCCSSIHTVAWHKAQGHHWPCKYNVPSYQQTNLPKNRTKRKNKINRMKTEGKSVCLYVRMKREWAGREEDSPRCRSVRLIGRGSKDADKSFK